MSENVTEKTNGVSRRALKLRFVFDKHVEAYMLFILQVEFNSKQILFAQKLPIRWLALSPKYEQRLILKVTIFHRKIQRKSNKIDKVLLKIACDRSKESQSYGLRAPNIYDPRERMY